MYKIDNNMKHFINKNILDKLVVIALICISLYSCSDNFLDLEPKTNTLEANSYNSEQDAFNAMAAVYDALAVQPWNFVPLQSDIFSDDAFCGGEQGGGMWQWQDQEIGIIDAENAAASALWNRCYSGIYRANMFFMKEDEIAWSSESLRNRMNAEIRLLRAYFNWDLARHFGWVPIIDKILPSSEEYKNQSQSTPEEMYQYLIKELLLAMPYLPDEVNVNETGRATKDVARILMARTYMFYEGFAKPVLGASADLSYNGTTIDKQYVLGEMENIIESHRYRLLDNYADVFAWDNENNAESIFEFQYSEKSFSGDWGLWNSDGNIAVIFYGPRNPSPDTVYSAGWSFGTVTWSLVNEFEEADSVRFNASVMNADDELDNYNHSFQNTGYFNRKYIPRYKYYPLNGTSELNWPKNYIDMRLAEVYLIASELALGTDNTKALTYLNEVRTRAMGKPAALSSINLDAIYHERRVELNGEGHRKWDLLRRGIDYTKKKIDASWDTPANIENVDDFSGRQFIADTWGMLPIPGSEIRLANAGILKQYVPAFK